VARLLHWSLSLKAAYRAPKATGATGCKSDAVCEPAHAFKCVFCCMSNKSQTTRMILIIIMDLAQQSLDAVNQTAVSQAAMRKGPENQARHPTQYAKIDEHYVHTMCSATKMECSPNIFATCWIAQISRNLPLASSFLSQDLRAASVVMRVSSIWPNIFRSKLVKP